MNSILIGLTQLVLLFFGGPDPYGPAVTSVAPETVEPGGAFIVEVTIYSGNRKCTANLEQEFSEGVEISEIDSRGVDVQYKNNKLRYIWAEIPAKKSITITYKVTLTGNDIKNVQITGNYFTAYNGKFTNIKTRPLLIRVSSARADQPIIHTNAPATASPGETIRIETIIDKADYTDFARLSLVFPKDVVAIPVDGENAKLLNENNEMKFLWSSLPAKRVLRLTCNVTIAADASDTIKITGKYSFSVNSRPAFVTIPPIAVVVKRPQLNSNPPATEPVVVQSKTEPHAVAKPVTETVTINRRMPAAANQVFYVDVTIEKGPLTAGGALEETLPEGYTAAIVAADSCKLEMRGNVAKFTWLTFPAQNRIRLVYKVSVKPGSAGDKSITGRFRYMENDTVKVADAGTSKITITDARPAVAAAAIPDDLKAADKNNDQFISSAELNDALAEFGASKGNWNAEKIDRLVAVFIYQ